MSLSAVQGFYRLLLGEDAGETDEARMMQMQVTFTLNVKRMWKMKSFFFVQMGAMGGGGQFDASAAFKQERWERAYRYDYNLLLIFAYHLLQGVIAVNEA